MSLNVIIKVYYQNLLQFDVGKWDVSLVYNFQTTCGSHPASNTMVTGFVSPGVKRQRRVAHNSPPTSAEVKNGGVIFSLPYKSSWFSA
jgi:hypothetical protein